MTDTTKKLIRERLLRVKAETQLRQGTAPGSKDWTINGETLTLLYKLASDPEQSDAALKLLHELQTYQVELDMQHEQLESNEYELVHALNYYETLYNHAPVGYFVVNGEGCIVEGNLAGAELLGVTQDELVNTPIRRLLAPASHAPINALLKKVIDERTGASCTVQPAIPKDELRLLRVTADIAPDAKAILMVLW